MSKHELDARNTFCPIPVIRTQNKIKQLKSGDILDVICTDPGALSDIPTWCRINGHTVVEAKEISGEVIVTIQVGDT